MKKLNQLLIIEADDNLPPLLSQFQSLLASFSEAPVATQNIADLKKLSIASAPQLALFHTNLISIEHLKQFIEVHQSLPYSVILIVGQQIDEQLCLLALEAGAEDAIPAKRLSTGYMQRAVILSLRRSRTEKELNQKHEQLLSCIQNTPNVAVQWYNLKGEIVFWNHASEYVFGWKAEEAMGKTLDQLILTPHEAQLFLKKIQQVKVSSSVSEPEEWSFRKKDGSDSYCISTLFAIQSFGSDSLIVCMDVDITAQKQIEKALRQSEEKYRSLLEQQADAITIFDETGKILEVNSSATQLLKYTKEEFQHLTFPDVLSRQEMKQNPVRFDVLARGESTIKQRKMQRKDGVLIETEVHAKRLYDGMFLASVRDISKRLEVQQKLEKEIELSDSVINSLPGLFYLFTKEGRYLRWNKQQETITGYSANEISSMNPLDFIDNDDRKIVEAAINETFRKGQAFTEAYLLTKEGNKIPYFFTGIAINYANTPCLLGAGTDLSPVKNLEAKLSQQKIAAQKKIMQAMIDAEEKEKNKLGLELHDNVNQILSVVGMYLAILNSDKPMEEVTLGKTIGLLNSAIEEIRQLSHGLAVNYKFGAGFKETLEAMINSIQAARDFSIELIADNGLDQLLNNDQKLAVYRIVQEQLKNIIKHAKATKVKVNIDQVKDQLSVSVTDNGIGFNVGDPNKGLGLINITNRAEALEGRVIIESAKGKGCLLNVTIPLKPLL